MKNFFLSYKAQRVIQQFISGAKNSFSFGSVMLCYML